MDIESHSIKTQRKLVEDPYVKHSSHTRWTHTRTLASFPGILPLRLLTWLKRPTLSNEALWFPTLVYHLPSSQGPSVISLCPFRFPTEYESFSNFCNGVWKETTFPKASTFLPNPGKGNGQYSSVICTILNEKHHQHESEQGQESVGSFITWTENLTSVWPEWGLKSIPGISWGQASGKWSAVQTVKRNFIPTCVQVWWK